MQFYQVVALPDRDYGSPMLERGNLINWSEFIKEHPPQYILHLILRMGPHRQIVGISLSEPFPSKQVAIDTMMTGFEVITDDPNAMDGIGAFLANGQATRID